MCLIIALIYYNTEKHQILLIYEQLKGNFILNLDSQTTFGI